MAIFGHFFALESDPKAPVSEESSCHFFLPSIYTILGENEIEEKLKMIDGAVQHHGSWSSKEHLDEFKELLKQFMFLAQGDSKAPVTGANLVDKIDDHIKKASTFENTIFWTPDQLSVVNALQMMFVFLDAFYSTGKSILLMYIANHWSNQIGKQKKSVVGPKKQDFCRGDQVSRISFDFLKWRSMGPQKLATIITFLNLQKK